MQNGAPMKDLADSHRETTSCVALACDGRSPAGIATNWNPAGRSPRNLGPSALSMRLWLNSVLTKVMQRPLWWRSVTSLSIAPMWLWAGTAKQTAGDGFFFHTWAGGQTNYEPGFHFRTRTSLAASSTLGLGMVWAWHGVSLHTDSGKSNPL
ncbi:hypothetical protein CRG98_032252 [Punica granatum]|uniref:Uncharacterized protein n=1 Tax=Punica granatum TaxID=22663 RepID=A0A2I0ITT9_PUNGR|nr:hypothetical protein CRG98_032252 [Punica granatum]